MTNEEKDLLIAYLVDAGDIDPDGGEEMGAEAGLESWLSPLLPHMAEIHALFIDTIRNPGGWEAPTVTEGSQG